jgi:hypothetical protein
MMKINAKGLLLVATITLVVLCSACSKTEKYGSTIIAENQTELKTVMADPAQYEGKTITISGEIIDECPTGCWFNLKSETGVLYVDLNPKGLAIPQKVGKNATVQGKVKVTGRNVSLIGEGVEIK